MFPQSLGRQYPFQSHFLNLSDLPHGENQMHYVDEGPLDADESMLMVHGNPTWSFYFRRLISHFSKTVRVVAPDHIGSGASKRPKGWNYQLKGHIDHLEALVDELELKNVTLVVHDWGGAIGFGLAVRRPELFKRIVILNTAAFYLSNIPKRIQMLKTPWLGEVLIRRLNLFAWPATFMASEKPLPNEVKKGYLWPNKNYDQRIGVSGFVKDIPMSKSHPTYQTLVDIESKLHLLNCPKLIVWGGKDFCFDDKFFEKWMKIYPHSKYRYIAEAGHYVLEDAPEEVLSEIANFMENGS